MQVELVQEGEPVDAHVLIGPELDVLEHLMGQIVGAQLLVVHELIEEVLLLVAEETDARICARQCVENIHGLLLLLLTSGVDCSPQSRRQRRHTQRVELDESSKALARHTPDVPVRVAPLVSRISAFLNKFSD